MNGAATRRSPEPPVIDLALPEEYATDAGLPSDTRARTPGRGRTMVHGLSVQVAYALIDTFFVCLGGALVIWIRFRALEPLETSRLALGPLSVSAYAGFFLLYAAIVVLGCASQNLYRTPRDRSFTEETRMVVKAVGLATALLSLFIFTSGDKDISRLVVAGSGALNLVTLAGWRSAKRALILRRTAAGIGASRVLIVGAGRAGRALARWFEENGHLGYNVCGFLDRDPKADPRVLGNVNDLRSVALAHFADELFITLPSERDLIKRMLAEARALRLRLNVVPELYDGLGWHAPLHSIGGFPVMELSGEPIPVLGLAVKRVLDVTLSAVGLLVSAPLFGVLAILIRLDSPGPVFYAAERVGRKGRRFCCYKLRTMVADADTKKEELRGENERNGPFFKMQNDPRVTRIGRWLRKLSFDELPQLWNVLRGEMSLVGPRPHPLDDYERYNLEHLRRLDVKPGLTGLWQVTARQDSSFETNMTLDLEYIENWNFWLDVKIVLRTVPAIFRGDGQ